MKTRKWLIGISLIMVLSMILAACAQPTAAPSEPETIVETVEVEVVETVEVEVVETVEVEVVETVVVEVTPTPRPSDRKGGWLDEIVFSLVSADSAVTQLVAKAIDIYGTGLSSKDLPSMQEAGLNYSFENGSYYELTYNSCGPVFEATGKLNPFAVAKVREAMNWLVDRDYINQEIYNGGALTKFFPITTQFPDYADLADVVRPLEAKYAYNPDQAVAQMTPELEALGATMVDGKWQYEGEPIVITMLIRTDHDGTRVPIGDYVGNQLESIGFATDRQYLTSSQASPIWILGNVCDGLFHIYTGAWGANIIDRDQGDNFQFFDSPSSAYGFSTLWQGYQNSEEYAKLIDDLAFNRFENLDERRVAFSRALELALEEGYRTWLIDGKNFAPWVQGVEVTYDLAAGVGNAQLWPYTLRYTDEEGGRMNWGQPDVFVDPWNAVSGSNWSYDGAAQRATHSWGVIFDPYTGLVWPQRVEKAEVTVREGLPVGSTLDWVSLTFEPEITVPDDAWVKWDAANQVFMTAAEAYTEPVTADVKSVVYYPAGMSDTVTWHDGSPITAADFVMGMIMTLDPGDANSVIFDESRASNLASFLSVFKGFKIASTDPLIIEYWNDGFQLDAELNVTTLWPYLGFGEGPWHVLAVGNKSEIAEELAYSPDKADALGVEWMSMIGGPSLEILAKYLDEAEAEGFIPYAPTMSQFVTAEEAAARYANLKQFYADRNHFWVGSGPYVLGKVFLTEKTLSLNWYPDFPDMSNRWDVFAEPKRAEVEIDGPGQVTIGDEATFDVYITFKGEPYALADIKQVKYLVYDATGALVLVELATAVEDGLFQVTLSADVTAGLSAGSNKLEVAVIPLVVAVPTFSSFEFVVAE
jgi:peptide/nickel transport system substrate-binding protein